MRSVSGYFSMLPGCGGGAGGGHWDKPQSAPTITKYSLAGIPGTINEPAKSIAVEKLTNGVIDGPEDLMGMGECLNLLEQLETASYFPRMSPVSCRK